MHIKLDIEVTVTVVLLLHLYCVVRDNETTKNTKGDKNISKILKIN